MKAKNEIYPRFLFKVLSVTDDEVEYEVYTVNSAVSSYFSGNITMKWNEFRWFYGQTKDMMPHIYWEWPGLLKKFKSKIEQE